jgi:hypothetical protein
MEDYLNRFNTQMKLVVKNKGFFDKEIKDLVHTYALLIEMQKNKVHKLLPSTEGHYYHRACIMLYDLTIYQMNLNLVIS